MEFQTLVDPEQMPGQKPSFFGSSLDWPYVEGLRLDEATHPLTLLTVGMYGHVLPNQNGAPIRIVVPWKYGFKSAKSLVRIRLVADEPKTSWNRAAPNEYGFYSNVNPSVDHPAVEPGDRAAHRRVPPAEDAHVQRLRRPGRVALRRDGRSTARGMTLESGALRRFYDDDALVELTAIIAWENASSKFNRALRVPSQGLWKRAGSADAPAERP